MWDVCALVKVVLVLLTGLTSTSGVVELVTETAEEASTTAALLLLAAAASLLLLVLVVVIAAGELLDEIHDRG